MRIFCFVVAAEGITLFAVSAYSHAFPSLILIASGIALIAFLSLTALLTGVLGILRWRKKTRWWMLPFLFSLLLLPGPWIAAPAGVALGDWQFRKHLDDYMRVVQEVKESKAPASEELTIVKIRDLPPNVRAIRTARCGDGGLVVEFLIASDVPLLHTGYVFNGYSQACENSAGAPEHTWPYLRHVSGNWYHFADEPGL